MQASKCQKLCTKATKRVGVFEHYQKSEISEAIKKCPPKRAFLKSKKAAKINIVCRARLDKYKSITEKALEMAKKAVAKGREKDAKEIIEMAECYLSDAKYFEKQGHYVNAFACLNYAHGWLDAGSRLGIFDVKDNKLFVVR